MSEVPALWQRLGLPGLADIHVHFLPPAMLTKVWQYFDDAERHYGMAWPIPTGPIEGARIATLARWASAASRRCATRTSRGWRPG